jgi:hypothetical protein
MAAATSAPERRAPRRRLPWRSIVIHAVSIFYILWIVLPFGWVAGDYLGTWYTETAAQTAEAAAHAVRDQLGR